MTWADLPVTGGRFSARDSESDYLRGEFYGPAAVGGVFERNRLLGAFGAARQSAALEEITDAALDLAVTLGGRDDEDGGDCPANHSSRRP